MPRYLHRPARAAERGMPPGNSDVRAPISGGDGLERADLVGAGPNDSGGRLGHFVPGTGEVAEWFRNHQPSLLTQAVEDLHLRMQLTQRCDVGGIEERSAHAFAGV